MKKILLSLIALCSFVLITSSVKAQDYKTAVGLKFGGYENGPSVKYFLNEGTAIEGVIGIRSHGVVFSGLYELHQQAFNTAGLKFYYGFGAHLGSVGSGVYKRFGGDDQVYNDSHILLGADGVLGLEYKIEQAPIAISLDLNPRVELATGPFFDVAPGLGVKYTF
ncbi:hypothetical protein FPZ42_15570 [Mucilaginibacter achroorhodeus]|uniref:DUF3575 domain-containing protein n=1 Tax=Mucilaginibacter achroorhodeus TaxID=2599294 RepID=A0A563TYS5_9SPHI|nr:MULTISPECIES: hypothetical protein [Mucilaginibacter]QXV65373.1 hypothetical protein INP83_20255 [Mucilaginibacter sp. 21P]TWR24518.1 hypothetical protein FPZ42_15570 [Mucilaginibacter achroorhodeus]